MFDTLARDNLGVDLGRSVDLKYVYMSSDVHFQVGQDAILAIL